MHLLSPVLLFDMIRLARRGRFILLRVLYAAFLGGIFILAYQSTFAWSHRAGREVSPQQLTAFAEQFFITFMSVQFGFVLLMTPAYVAGGIAEEKERRTLEFMLTTTLHVPEIVFSKLCSRMANVALFVLAGLPILSIIQLFGGVNPQWLWFGFAGTGITVLSLSAISTWASVQCRKPRQAIMATYMAIAAYYVIWLILLAIYGGRRAAAPAAGDYGLVYVLEFWQLGNPLYATMRATGVPSLTGLNRTITLWELLRNYALFHGTLAFLCIVHAMWRLRPVYMRQTYGTPKAVKVRRHRRRKAVYEPAMMWKELHGDAPRMTWGGRILFALIVIACLIPLGFMLYEDYSSGFRYWQRAMNIYVRVVGTGVACLLLLVIAVRAATSIGSERDRQTLDSLLSSPLTEREILTAKWVSSLKAGLPLGIFLVLIWTLGVLTGGLHILAVPLLLGTVLIYAAFVSALGLMWSTGAKNTTRGLVWTIGTTIFWGGGHWIITAFIVIPLAFVMREWPFLVVAGFTPPFVLGWMAFDWEHAFNVTPWRGASSEVTTMWISSIVAVGLCAALAVSLWQTALTRFRRANGRIHPRRILRTDPVDAA